MHRMLIVEDDSGIAHEVAALAKCWDMDSRCADNFRDVLSEFKEYDPHIAVLDISLPFFDGYHWCSEIRKISNVPIIFISSASDNMNIIMAVNMGADDFIAKPFDGNVFMAKVQALLRRAYDFAPKNKTCEHKGAVLNPGDSTLLYGENKVQLTKNECRILTALMENKGNAVSRERLMEKLWETDSFVDENTLTVNVNRLRKKLCAAGLDGFITTKIGIGYIIE